MKIHFFSKANCPRCDIWKQRMQEHGLMGQTVIYRMEDQPNEVIDWMCDHDVDTFPTVFLERDGRLLTWHSADGSWYDRFVAKEDHWNALLGCLHGVVETASTDQVPPSQSEFSVEAAF
jgi:glutaredoxin